MWSPKKIKEPDQYPFLVKQGSVYNHFGFINRPLENLDHPFFKNDCQITRQNASSSSSSSSSPPIFNNAGTLSIDQHANVIKSQAEMTIAGAFALEEFVMRQGGLNGEGNNFMSRIDHQVVSQWEHEGVVELKYSVSENGFENKMMDIGYLGEQLKLPMSMADKGSDAQGGIGNKSNFKDERMAKSIERKQRRMIKNRESAARSRARKQAYSNQLQHTVLQLQTTNNYLKKRKEVELLLNSSSTSGPRFQLRRTSSSSF